MSETELCSDAKNIKAVPTGTALNRSDYLKGAIYFFTPSDCLLLLYLGVGLSYCDSAAGVLRFGSNLLGYMYKQNTVVHLSLYLGGVYVIGQQ